jgi:amino acid adenylation domain-containing protein
VLDARANRLAHALRAEGVGPESRVGVLLERSPDLLVAVLGVLKAGGAYVPMDPAYPPERLAYMATESGIRCLVTQASHAGRVPGAPAVIRLDADAAGLAAQPAGPPAVRMTPDNLAYVIYTSGSTGRPKGVMVQHRSAGHLAAALGHTVYAGGPAPLRVAMNAPAAFDASVKQWIQLLHGHTLQVVPEEERLDARRLAARLGEWGVDVLDCTPTQLRALLAAGLGTSGRAPRLVLVGGEAIDPALWTRLGELPATVAWNVYGPTEATVDATAAPVRAGGAPTLGGALPNMAVRLLDEALRPVPLGVAGEMCIAGAGVARGYLGQPARTAERFVPDPFGPAGTRMYRSGDRARLHPDGRLESLGRADDQVKVRGVRLELGEVEAILMEHPAVAAAAAGVRELGRGEPELVAWYAPRPGAGAEGLQAELRAALRARLPDFLVPSLLAAVPELPRTSSGKVDRQALPDPRPLAAPAVEHVAPRGEVESILAEIWRDVLGVERVGVHDRFFEMGGNSLLIVQVYDRLTARLGERITLVELFQYPTIAELAERLGEDGPGAAAASAAVGEAEARAARQRQAMERRRQGAGGRES